MQFLDYLKRPNSVSKNSPSAPFMTSAPPGSPSISTVAVSVSPIIESPSCQSRTLRRGVGASSRRDLSQTEGAEAIFNTVLSTNDSNTFNRGALREDDFNAQQATSKAGIFNDSPRTLQYNNNQNTIATFNSKGDGGGAEGDASFGTSSTGLFPPKPSLTTAALSPLSQQSLSDNKREGKAGGGAGNLSGYGRGSASLGGSSGGVVSSGKRYGGDSNGDAKKGLVRGTDSPTCSISHIYSNSSRINIFSSFFLWFRSWYIDTFCNEAGVEFLLRLQGLAPPRLYGAVHNYFAISTELGNELFYVLVSPCLFWMGFEKEGMDFLFLLGAGLVVTNIFKDLVCAPRPPSPPVRRGGSASHAQEYGFPSTHTCCACLLATTAVSLITRWASATDAPGETPGRVIPAIATAVGALFAANIALSRLFLGLHWLGDIISGFVFFLGVYGAHAFFVRTAWAAIQDDYARFFIALPFLVGHVLITFLPTPPVACPCFLDSVRFIGVNAGTCTGVWARRRASIPLPVIISAVAPAIARTVAAATPISITSSSALIRAFLSFRFAGRYLLGGVSILAGRFVLSFFLEGAIARFLRWTAEGASSARAAFVRKLLAAAVAIFLGKDIAGTPGVFGVKGPVEGEESNNIDSSLIETNKSSVSEFSDFDKRKGNVELNNVSRRSDTASEIDGMGERGGVTAVTTGGVKEEGDLLPSGSESMGQTTTGWYPVKNHGHWTDACVLSKYIIYFFMGFGLSFYAPILQNAVFGTEL